MTISILEMPIVGVELPKWRVPLHFARTTVCPDVGETAAHSNISPSIGWTSESFRWGTNNNTRHQQFSRCKQQHWASAIFQMLPIIVCSKATQTSDARGIRDSACIHSFRLSNSINDAQRCHRTDWQQWPPFSPSLQNYRRYESLCARNLSKKTHTTKTTKLRY